MANKSVLIDTQPVEQLVDETAMAIAFVNAASREISTTNNNSICARLNPGGEFSSDCARYCGLAFEKAVEAGQMIGYECHAGLECRAVEVKGADEPLTAIIGRTFVNAENYRKATERAISGDWRSYPPAELFENILLTGSQASLDKAAKKFEAWATERASSSISELPVKTTEPQTPPVDPVIGSKQVKLANDPALAAPVGPDVKVQASDNRTAEAKAWRSFFSSLLKTDYVRAANSILEFLAHHYKLSSLVWLAKSGDTFENTATFGEMKNRRVRVGIVPGDTRLIEAMRQEVPLELGERSKDGSAERTLLMFPVGIEGEVSAALATLDPIADPKIKKQIARICHSIAPQLEILRLRNEVSRSETLANAVRHFSDSLKRIDTEGAWLELTQNTAQMLGAERASLLIYNKKNKTLDIKALIGTPATPQPGAGIGARVSKKVFTRGEIVAIPDVERTSLTPAPTERRYKSPSFLSCPIMLSGRTIGVMNFTDRAGGEAFDKSSLDLYQAIAPQLAVAIDRALLKEKAGEFEQLSVTDALTGLLNRRYIEERLMEEAKRSNRHGFPMSFMMLDVDHFKTYNDEYGHPAGDEALKTVGHVIRETLRGADVAARYGGEEFSILLPQTTSEEAAAIAERIRVNIERTDFQHRKVTISIGIASCSAELCQPAKIVSAADKALYEAKRRGRNTVLAFEGMRHQPVEAHK